MYISVQVYCAKQANTSKEALPKYACDREFADINMRSASHSFRGEEARKASRDMRANGDCPRMIDVGAFFLGSFPVAARLGPAGPSETGILTGVDRGKGDAPQRIAARRA